MLLPSRPIPPLDLPTLNHGTLTLASHRGENGTVLVFYRGLHCPICIRQLRELEEKLDQFEALGMSVAAISPDTEDRARETAEKAAVSRLPIAWGLPLKSARDDWGLYISSARPGTSEPSLFSEPGHFVVRPDGTLFAAWVQTAPQARPRLDDLLAMIRFAQERNYPPRGTYTGPLEGD